MDRIFNITLTTTLGATSLLLLSCATEPTSRANQRPVAASRIIHTPCAANPEIAAQITVVRDSGAYGSAPSAKVFLNGRPIAAFRVREALTFTVDPGQYVIGVEPSPNLGAALREYTLSAKPGEHYFYRISTTEEAFILQPSYELTR